MTASTAPSGLKLTEEQVAIDFINTLFAHVDPDKDYALWKDLSRKRDGAARLLRDALVAQTEAGTLRAERDSKDAEIARLTASDKAFRGFYDAACEQRNEALNRATRAEAERDAALRTCAALQKECDANSRAEARLAAMASVTEEMVDAAWAKFEELNDGGGVYRDAMKFAIRAAFEAFVANKTAGGTCT